jgi:hypothetical protein
MKMCATGVVKGGASKFASDSLPFKRLRHFCVQKSDGIAGSPVSEESGPAGDLRFKAVCRFVIVDYWHSRASGIDFNALDEPFHSRCVKRK